MAQIALGTTTIENIVAHDAAALEKDLAGLKPDAQVALPGVPQIVTRLQQMLSDPNVGIPQLVPVINYEPVLVGRVVSRLSWHRLAWSAAARRTSVAARQRRRRSARQRSGHVALARRVPEGGPNRTRRSPSPGRSP